jgi:hypothetical protein
VIIKAFGWHFFFQCPEQSEGTLPSPDFRPKLGGYAQIIAAVGFPRSARDFTNRPLGISQTERLSRL